MWFEGNMVELSPGALSDAKLSVVIFPHAIVCSDCHTSIFSNKSERTLYTIQVHRKVDEECWYLIRRLRECQNDTCEATVIVPLLLSKKRAKKYRAALKQRMKDKKTPQKFIFCFDTKDPDKYILQ